MTQRYDTYKDSGMQWLGEIPGHWGCVSLRKFLRIFSEKNCGDKQLLSVTREQGVVVRDISSKEDNHNFIPNDLSGYKHVQIGNFVINKMKSWQGSYGVSNYEGIVSPAYYTCKLEGINKTFFNLAIRSKIYVSFFGRYSKGIRVDQWDLSPVALKSIPFAVPPLSEQRSIVSFLDAKCGKIDEWVTKKQKEVEHLQELKQRVIADAVTRGLNPHVKMKTTNIPWIKEIPEHWEIYRYGTLFKLKPVKQHHGEELLSVFLNLGVIRAAESDKRTHAASEDLSKYQLVEETDFVMNNQQAWRGSVGVSKLVGIISPAYHIFKMPNCMFPDYANYLLRSKCMVSQFEMSSRGVGSIQRTLNFNWLNNKIVPVPPLSEQRSIVSYLDAKSSKIDKLIANITKEIECIKEYKQRLISDVVTGQIKVC